MEKVAYAREARCDGSNCTADEAGTREQAEHPPAVWGRDSGASLPLYGTGATALESEAHVDATVDWLVGEVRPAGLPLPDQMPGTQNFRFARALRSLHRGAPPKMDFKHKPSRNPSERKARLASLELMSGKLMALVEQVHGPEVVGCDDPGVNEGGARLPELKMQDS